MKGTDDDICQLFMKRLNLSSYVKLIDYYGLCIVPRQKWNDVDLLTSACANNDVHDCFEAFFTCSDEAFLLLVLKNYAYRWYVEHANKTKPVRAVSCVVL